jgi:hypothetical protein
MHMRAKQRANSPGGLKRSRGPIFVSINVMLLSVNVQWWGDPRLKQERDRHENKTTIIDRWTNDSKKKQNKNKRVAQLRLIIQKNTHTHREDNINLYTYHEQEQQQHQQKQQAFEAWSLCEGDGLSGSCWLEGVGCWRRDRLLS